MNERISIGFFPFITSNKYMRRKKNDFDLVCIYISLLILGDIIIVSNNQHEIGLLYEGI